ncbi:hypothetical protein MAFF241648_21160 [Ralstonia solanacearum]|nr:hypothetical protein MAFF241648_21160 [Ralstonia solanacearum]
MKALESTLSHTFDVLSRIKQIPFSHENSAPFTPDEKVELQQAIQINSVSDLRNMAERGVDLSKERGYALIESIGRQSNACAQYLMNAIRIYADVQENMPLLMAAASGNINMMVECLDRIELDHGTASRALTTAASMGQQDAVFLLMMVYDGYTPSDIADARLAAEDKAQVAFENKQEHLSQRLSSLAVQIQYQYVDYIKRVYNPANLAKAQAPKQSHDRAERAGMFHAV